jgi:hypothetical protein
MPNFDVIIDADDFSIDMKSGLETLAGVSETVQRVTEAALTESVRQRVNHKNKVRTNLKRNFKSSYGQVFSVDIYDEDLKKNLARIGQGTLAEVIAYFISEAMYEEPRVLSAKAQNVVNKLGDESNKLVEKLRRSSLTQAHAISVKFGRSVRIRYRKSREHITELAKLDEKSYQVLLAAPEPEKQDLSVKVSRLNTHTGNGRFLIEGEDETVAFGFGIPYRAVRIEAKKVFSENLHNNNGLDNKDCKYLKVIASPVRLKDGTVVKYIVTGFYQNE